MKATIFLERHNVDQLLFVDGNHDWHPWLRVRKRKHEALIANARTVPLKSSGRVR